MQQISISLIRPKMRASQNSANVDVKKKIFNLELFLKNAIGKV